MATAISPVFASTGEKDTDGVRAGIAANGWRDERVRYKMVNKEFHAIETLLNEVVAENNAVHLSTDEYDAVHGAASPSASNVMATIDDVTTAVIGLYDYENYMVFFDHFIRFQDDDGDQPPEWDTTSNACDLIAAHNIDFRSNAGSGTEVYLTSYHAAESSASVNPTIRTKFKIPDLTFLTTVKFGFYDTSSTDAIWFVYTPGTDGNWHCVTDDGSTTDTDTGVTVDTGYHTFEIVVTGGGTSVAFYIDDTLEATHTTNITSNTFSRYYAIDPTGTNSREVDIDWFYLKQEVA